jgi:hypothetical protein
MKNVFDEKTKFGMCQTGAVATAKDLAPYARSAAKLRPATPVLTAMVDLDMLMKHMTKDCAGCFGLGRFKVDDCVLLTMRLQVGTLQIYWLADASDPEVWKTIDAWKKGGMAGFALVQERNAAFFPWEIKGPQNGVEQFRGECGKGKAWEFMQASVKLIESGIVERTATTDIPGVRLEHVLVNILMTDRLAKVVKKQSLEQLAHLPEFSRPADATVH